MFIEDRPLRSWKTSALLEPLALPCRDEFPLSSSSSVSLLFLFCLFSLVTNPSVSWLTFMTLMSLILEFSTSPFVFYHSMFYLSLSVYTLSSVAGVVRRRRLHHWRSEESSHHSGWPSVGMLSLPRHPEISGEGSGSRPPQPTNKGGLGLVSFALLGSLTALPGPAKA